MTPRRAQIAGREISYDVVGEGPPLVLLHAFPFDRRMWHQTAEAMAGEISPLIAPVMRTSWRPRMVITPDLRGFGQSPLSPFSIADLADDVAALMDTLGLSRATIAGLSMGGYVALAFAQRHRARLEALVLADTKAGADSPEARKARGEAIALVQTQGVAAYLEKQLPRLVAPGASQSVQDTVRRLGQQAPESVIAGLTALRDRPDRTAELAAILCPTLVVVGAEDALTPPAEARAMAAAIRGATLIEISGAGHLSNLEAPQSFSAALATQS